MDRLRFRPARHATVACQGGRVVGIRTITIPPYTATDEQVKEVRRKSAAWHVIPHADAVRNVQQILEEQALGAAAVEQPKRTKETR